MEEISDASYLIKNFNKECKNKTNQKALKSGTVVKISNNDKKFISRKQAKFCEINQID